MINKGEKSPTSDKNMKRVSFKVANAIAKASYFGKYNKRCVVEEIVDSEMLILNEDYSLIYKKVPTYLEIWLWLWRERHSFLECVYKEGRFFNYRTSYSYADPEEAIIAAIEYLVSNNLI